MNVVNLVSSSLVVSTCSSVCFVKTILVMRISKYCIVVGFSSLSSNLSSIFSSGLLSHLFYLLCLFFIHIYVGEKTIECFNLSLLDEIRSYHKNDSLS